MDCLSAIVKKSVYWSSSWARILNVFDVYSFHHHRRCWPTFIQYLPTMYLIQAYPQNSGSILGQRCSLLLVQCRSIVYDADPALIYHRVCCMLCANTCHSTNTVSMLTHSLRRWPVIEAALGDCTVFSDCCIMLVTFKIPAPETPDNRYIGPMLM